MEHYQAVFSLLKTSLWGAERYPFVVDADTDWEKVYKELSDHSIVALTTDVAATIPGLNQKLKLAWMQKTMQNINKFQRLIKEQQALCLLFREANIPYVILKGASAATYYPNPEHRAMGDIDIIVRPQDFDRAWQLMLNNQYDCFDTANDRHYEFKKNAIIFELHRYFSVLSDMNAAKTFDEMIYAGTESPVEDVVGGVRFNRLDTLENGLVLLSHIDQHLEAGLGLRQIIDWMLFVDRHLDDCLWQEQFEPMVKVMGLKKLAMVVTRVCQMYLGLREEGITWCKDAEEDLCQEFMMVTMDRGNFGRKRVMSSQTKMALGAFGSILDWPKQMQLRGLYNWKAAKKYPILRPFAWVYQICRYIRKGFSRKNPIKSLMSDVKEQKREKELFDRLEVSRRADSEATLERIKQNIQK